MLEVGDRVVVVSKDARPYHHYKVGQEVEILEADRSNRQVYCNRIEGNDLRQYVCVSQLKLKETSVCPACGHS